MAKTTEEVDLIVRAIAEGFNQVIEEINDTKEATDDSGKSAKESGSRWTELASKLNLAKEAFSKVQKVVDVTIETIKRGAEVEATRKTFDSLAVSIGSTGDVLNKELRSATKGMVADLDLMQSANRFLAMGLAETSEEVSQLSRTAVQLGAAMGVGPAQAMEDFALLLANQSIPRLDTFGISSGKVRERIAELTTGVNALDKEAAFMQATMEQASLTLDKVGDSTEGTASSIARLEASTQNLKDTMSEAFAKRWEPIITGVANTVDNLATKQEKLDEAVKAGLITQEKADILYNRMLLTFSDWGGEAGDVIGQLDRLQEKQAVYNSQLEYVNQLMAQGIAPAEEIAEANTNIGYSLDLVNQSIENGEDAWKAYQESIKLAAEAEAEQINTLTSMLGTIDQASSIIESGYGAAALAAEDSTARQLAADEQLSQQLKQSAFDVAEARILAQGGEAIANLESLLDLQTELGLITQEEAEKKLTQAENTEKTAEVTQELMDVFLSDGVLAREESERLDEVVTLIGENTTLTKESLIAMATEGLTSVIGLNQGFQETQENIFSAVTEAGKLKDVIIDGIPDKKIVTIEIRTTGNVSALTGSGGSGNTTSDVLEESGGN